MFPVIEIIYILFCALLSFVVIRQFIKSRSYSEEIMYAVVFIPFILRVLQLK